MTSIFYPVLTSSSISSPDSSESLPCLSEIETTLLVEGSPIESFQLSGLTEDGASVSISDNTVSLDGAQESTPPNNLESLQQSAIMLESILLRLEDSNNFLSIIPAEIGKKKIKSSIEELDELFGSSGSPPVTGGSKIKEKENDHCAKKAASYTGLSTSCKEDRNTSALSISTSKAIYFGKTYQAAGYLQLMEYRNKVLKRNGKLIATEKVGSTESLKIPHRLHNLTVYETVVKRSELFKRLYDSREFPVRIQHCSPFNRLLWEKPLFKHNTEVNSSNDTLVTSNSYYSEATISEECVDFKRYLPFFLSGILCNNAPYHFIAIQGSNDLLNYIPERDLTVKVVKDITIGMKILLNEKRLQNIGIHLLRDFLLRLSSKTFVRQVAPNMLRQLLPDIRSIYNDKRPARWQTRSTSFSQVPSFGAPREQQKPLSSLNSKDFTGQDHKQYPNTNQTIGSIARDSLTLMCLLSDETSTKLISHYIPVFEIPPKKGVKMV